MISIITITYNAERFLERTISSIAGQERCVLGVDYEYIIVDGASKDSTLSIIRQHEKQLTRWVSEPDRGLYDAMNKGLYLATGDYVWFMNAGDEIHDPAVLSKLLTAIRTTHADIYYSDALFVSDNGTTHSGPPVGLRSEVTPHTLPTNLRWQDMALGMKVSHQAFVARRAIAPDYAITNLSADLDWEIRCLKAAQYVQYLPFALCKYLVGGLSVQQHRRSLMDRFRVLATHFGLLPTLWNHARIVARAVGRR
ncbi:glycosyltransferase [Fibrella sp. HMF5335]|uniref:Glycosyltransferase n=1 Tax=Fibrella rubiginis TaxID=2817060 RepID=A0A939K5F0_9BACT|nr:glycosyltransferase family 2 protein [Fibrella rubiginis]MBO0939414.1 glycosyltransferase [Fibrella rubiginis]